MVKIGAPGLFFLSILSFTICKTGGPYNLASGPRGGGRGGGYFFLLHSLSRSFITSKLLPASSYLILSGHGSSSYFAVKVRTLLAGSTSLGSFVSRTACDFNSLPCQSPLVPHSHMSISI